MVSAVTIFNIEIKITIFKKWNWNNLQSVNGFKNAYDRNYYKEIDVVLYYNILRMDDGQLGTQPTRHVTT